MEQFDAASVEYRVQYCAVYCTVNCRHRTRRHRCACRAAKQERFPRERRDGLVSGAGPVRGVLLVSCCHRPSAVKIVSVRNSIIFSRTTARSDPPMAAMDPHHDRNLRTTSTTVPCPVTPAILTNCTRESSDFPLPQCHPLGAPSPSPAPSPPPQCRFTPPSCAPAAPGRLALSIWPTHPLHPPRQISSRFVDAPGSAMKPTTRNSPQNRLHLAKRSLSDCARPSLLPFRNLSVPR